MSEDDISAMLHELTEAKMSISAIMAVSDVTAPRRRTVEISLEKYHEHFHAVSSAYLRLAAKFEAVIACGSLFDAQARALGDAVRVRVQDDAPPPPPPPAGPVSAARSYAEIVGTGRGPQIHFPNGPTVELPRRPRNRVIVEPSAAAAERFPSGEATRQALQESVDPGALGIKISRVSRVRNNGLRVHACDGDLQKLKGLQAIREAGLEVKDDVGLNPRLRLGNVPAAMSREAVLANLVEHNLADCDASSTRVIYVYPSRGRRLTRCVIETSAEVRKRLLALSEISLGWSTCYVEDHIRVLQCYRCWNFGHVLAECHRDPRCRRCAGAHLSRDCEDEGGVPVCANCKAAGLAAGHIASDAAVCPILRRRIADKARLIDYE